MPSDGEANAVKVEATGTGRTTLTAGASHIMEVRGTLGVRMRKFFAGKKADAMLAFGQVKYLAAMRMSSVARKNPELRLITVSPGNTKGTDASNHVPLALRLLLKYFLFPIVMPLFGIVHNLETGAGRIVHSIDDTSIKSGRFYASAAGKLTGPLVDQSTIRPEMNNETYQENANRAVHRFIS